MAPVRVLATKAVGMLRWLVWLAALMSPVPMLAGGSRIVPGQGWGVPPWYNVSWHTDQVRYFTDPGPLSATVDHDRADAMVQAAAAVWNVPTSSVGLQQGGTLPEHLSPENVTFDGSEVAVPSEVQTANEDAIPIVIAYDPEGQLIDLLLGQDASEPDGCRQNAVVGDIDDVHQDDGSIRHATLILNGRCVGAAPDDLLQMQYQLTRKFGQVLGLSWSQTNENVFTAQTTVTGNQVAFWPLMHPLDVICGNYTYQCMSNPFQLRVDDLNTLAQLYPINQGNVPAGKRATSDDALYLWGILSFPTGQGMDWVNITTRRQNNSLTEDWETTSAITGVLYTQAAASPVNATPAANSGYPDGGFPGYFTFRRVPLDGTSNVFFTTEAINPLYVGDAAVGPYVRPPATPSGTSAGFVDWSAVSAGDARVGASFTVPDAANSCNPGRDGTEDVPAELDSSGWQPGLLCGDGHNSWWSVSAAAGHSWTVEVTATDETGAVSLNKAQPVMGVWASSDPTGSAPTVSVAQVPFNSLAPGVTQMAVDAADSDQSYRFSVSDQYGAGRPDFTYTARLLYAATVTPAVLGLGGGQIVISGTGFREGNQVLVNGIPARVLQWSATQIVAFAPTQAATGAAMDTPVDVAVIDQVTNGSATINAAVQYHVLPNLLQQISAPPALETGVTAAQPFAVRVVASDGISPVPHVAVSLAVLQGGAQAGLCGAASACTGFTDEEGVLATTLTGTAVGPVLLAATDPSGGGTVQLVLVDTDPVRSVHLEQDEHYLAAGASATWTLQIEALQDELGAAGVPVSWTAGDGVTIQSSAGMTGAGGVATVTVSTAALPAGATRSVTACAWVTVCAVWTLHSVDPSQWVVAAAPGLRQTVSETEGLSRLQLEVTDEAGHLLEGAQVQLYQRVLGWEGSCGTAERCPSAPVLTSSQSSLVSDAVGTLSFDALSLPGIPQVIEVAASTGTHGFLALTLVKTP